MHYLDEFEEKIITGNFTWDILVNVNLNFLQFPRWDFSVCQPELNSRVVLFITIDAWFFISYDSLSRLTLNDNKNTLKIVLFKFQT